MAFLKVFVSSTCYDLTIVRSELRAFLINLGHDPIMSDYNDVLFDPRIHTHESCIKEIVNTDAVILIIGSRFGGNAIPKAVSSLDIEFLKTLSKGVKLLDNSEKISITQLEILKAIEFNIPIFTFIDSRVMYDHQFYEKNKDKGILNNIEFPSIDKKENAIYIFEFINFLRLRSKNNSISEFSKLSDIEEFLRKQWSSLFQRLLYEQRLQKSESQRIEQVSEELKDIKSLILSSISTEQAKEVGRGVIRFRRSIEFFLSLGHPNIEKLLIENISWEELCKKLQIKEGYIAENPNRFMSTIYLIKNDGTYYEGRQRLPLLRSILSEWNNFRIIKSSIKQEIVNALKDNFLTDRIFIGIKYKNVQFADMLQLLLDSDSKEEKGISRIAQFNINTLGKSTTDENAEES